MPTIEESDDTNAKAKGVVDRSLFEVLQKRSRAGCL